MKKYDFNLKEIIAFYQTAEWLGLQPLMIVKETTHGEFKFAWVDLKFRGETLHSKIYDAKYIASRFTKKLKNVNLIKKELK